MARIIGLQEQKQALTDIQSTLKEIQVINNFLQATNLSGEYEISFTAVGSAPENGVEKDMDTPNHEEAGTENKKAQKHAKNTRIAAPFICKDPTVVRKYVLLSKKEKVKKIVELSNKYNIELDAKEESILSMFEEEMRNE